MARGKCTIFDLPTLQEATENFSEKHKLGEGGFGSVYKVNKQAKMRENFLSTAILFSSEKESVSGKTPRWARNSSEKTFRQYWTWTASVTK